MGPPENALRACQTCYKRKIKCDRVLPKCTPCTTNRRNCAYLSPRLPESEKIDNGAGLSQAEVFNLKGPSSPVVPRPNTTGLRFLDPSMFSESMTLGSSLVNATESCPSYVDALLPDKAMIRSTLVSFFDRIHPWLPFMSKDRVFNTLLNPLVPTSSIELFLCLCVKLLERELEECEDPLTTAEYVAAKRWASELELTGTLSMSVLQGHILIATYELAHAIYPAVYSSVGTCITYGVALGLGFEESGQCDRATGSNLFDEDERLRTWWTIFLLDRFANLNNPQHAFVLPDPPQGASIPNDNTGLDADRRPSSANLKRATLFTPTERLGRFANVIQAAYLLGCVYRHVNDTKSDAAFHTEEREQLDNTIHAQMKYQEINVGLQNSIRCYQTALSFNALSILYTHSTRSTQDHHPAASLNRRAEYIAHESASIAVQTIQRWLDIGTAYEYPHGDAPPFVIPWLYSTGVWLLQEQAEADLHLVELALEKLNSKWRMAGFYRKLLEARRTVALG